MHTSFYCALHYCTSQVLHILGLFYFQSTFIKAGDSDRLEGATAESLGGAALAHWKEKRGLGDRFGGLAREMLCLLKIEGKTPHQLKDDDSLHRDTHFIVEPHLCYLWCMLYRQLALKVVSNVHILSLGT